MAIALRTEDLSHHTHADYVRREGRWELIDGVAYAVPPAPTFHPVSHDRRGGPNNFVV